MSIIGRRRWMRKSVSGSPRGDAPRSRVTWPVTPAGQNAARMIVVDTPLFDLSVLDAVEWLRAQPAESIDLLVTDPAYESLEKHRAVGTTTRLKHSKGS